MDSLHWYSRFLTKIWLTWKHTNLSLTFAVKRQACHIVLFAHYSQYCLLALISKIGTPLPTQIARFGVRNCNIKGCKLSILLWNYILISQGLNGIWGVIFYTQEWCICPTPSDLERREKIGTEGKGKTIWKLGPVRIQFRSPRRWWEGQNHSGIWSCSDPVRILTTHRGKSLVLKKKKKKLKRPKIPSSDECIILR